MWFLWESLYEAQYLVVGDIVYKSCPKCSRDNGEQHIYYDCPKTFGITSGRENRKNPIPCKVIAPNVVQVQAGSDRIENAFPCSQAKETKAT